MLLTKKIKRKINKKTIIKQSKIKILIIGGGPTGLFTAIDLRHKFKEIGINPIIHIIDFRLNKRTRNKQVVVIKKKYNIINKLHKYEKLLEYLNKYKECTLDNSKQIEDKRFRDGPYLCSSKNYDNDDGITILLSNIEKMFMEYIKKFNICKLVEVNRGDKYTLEYITNYKPDIIIGASGGLGYVKRNLLRLKKKLLKDTKRNKDVPQLVYNKNAGMNEDSYMLLYRFPLKTKEGFNLDDEIAFAWRKNKNSNLIDSIYISSQEDTESKERKMIKQIYFHIKKDLFRELTDCRFWRPCNIKDVLNSRLEISYCDNIENEEGYNRLMNIFPNLKLKGKRLLSENTLKKNIEIYENYNTSIKEGLSFFIQLVSYEETIDPELLYKKGTLINLEFINWDRDNIPLRLSKKYSGKILYSKFLGLRKEGTWNIGIWQIQIDNIKAMEYVKSLYNKNFKRTTDRILIDTIPYLTKELENSDMRKKTDKIYDSIIEFCEFNKNIIKPTYEEFKEKSEMIRIWTAVRWVNSFIEEREINNKKTLIIPLGDEAIQVNPLTGSGVSVGFKNSINMTDILIDKNWKNKNFKDILSSIKFQENKKEYVKEMGKLRDISIERGDWAISNFKRL